MKEVAAFTLALKKYFPYAPTPGQDALLHALSRFTFSKMPRCTLLVKGYAGTGKTTAVGAYVGALRLTEYDIVLLAPTGRAAKVLSQYAKRPAFTIHKKIYFPTKNSSGGMAYGLGVNRHKKTIFLVDEASMIGGHSGMSSDQSFQYRDLLEDLIDFVFQGEDCRLILVGDQAQLPPVGSDESPALDTDSLRSSFYLTIADIQLTDVVRQEMDSGILFNATSLRKAITSGQEGFPRLHPEGFADVIPVSGEDLEEVLDQLYSKYTREGVMLITRSNKRANQFNQHIRSRILWYEEELNAGDLLMVVKNNYFWLNAYKDAPTNFIANGDIVEVIKVVRYHEIYGRRFADVEVRLLDYPDFIPFEVRILVDTINVEGPNLPMAEIKALYHAITEDYLDLRDRKKIHKAVMEDPFYNALQIKFAYAVTCHKSQGGQWPAIIVDQGYLTEEMLDISLLRWFYTAFTRAQEEIYLLNFHPEFFGEDQE